MTAKPKWAVARWFPLPNGERVTKYWCRDGGVSDWAGTDGLSPITTWPTKRAAEDAYRLFGRGDIRDIRVVKLDTIPGANTKPLPPTVQAALAKAKETAVTEPEVSHDDSPEPLEPATVQVPAEVDAELFPDLRSPRGRQAWSPIIYARKVDSEKAGIVREHADTTEHTYDPQQRAQVGSAVARQIERLRFSMTAPGDPMPTDEARKLTDRIKFDAEQLWDKVIDASSAAPISRWATRRGTTTAPKNSRPAGCGCRGKNAPRWCRRCGTQDSATGPSSLRRASPAAP